MLDARQAAYLHALGVDVYVPRDVASRPLDDVHAPAPPLQHGSPEPPPAEDADVGELVRAPAAEQSAAVLDWPALREAVAACQRCDLHQTRTQAVFGVGNPQARWMFIGEAPGQEEDRQGEPFVGRAGQLLNAMIRALGMRREDVFIANVLKCRPPGNRDPRPAEAASCRQYLERQVELVDPTIVIAVGRIAAQDLLATDTPIAKLRGRVHAFGSRAWPLIVTYHPAYLLRSPGEKRKAWADLLQARQLFARLERERAGAGTA
jgi:uracil-DNA glycosylase family 4